MYIIYIPLAKYKIKSIHTIIHISKVYTHTSLAVIKPTKRGGSE